MRIDVSPAAVTGCNRLHVSGGAMGIEVKLGTIAQVVMKLESRPCGVPEGASIRKSRAWDKAGEPGDCKHGDLVSLDQFLAKRGGSAIVARGRALKQSKAALFASIRPARATAGHLTRRSVIQALQEARRGGCGRQPTGRMVRVPRSAARSG